MDRISFIPGAQAREEIFDAKGRICVDRPCAIDFANEFILPCVASGTVHVYQATLAAVGAHEQLEISFGLRDARPGEEFASGELPGMTTAELVNLDTSARLLLWEVGRCTATLDDAYAARAFHAYRRKLSAHLGMAADGATGEPVVRLPEHSTTISRALAPTSLYHTSGAMFYFVDIAPPPGSTAYDVATVPVLSRPMRALDALILGALLALVWHRPPLVFAVVQHNERLGQLPSSLKRVTYVDAEDAWPADDVEEVSIVI
jgi:hypothetical protein